MEICLIGLGNMGKNLAKNIDSKGYTLNVYNRTTSKTRDLVQENPKIIGHETIKQMIENVKSPKIVFIILTAGSIIDDILDELDQYLNENDVAIDLGNSYFKDTIRRTTKYKFNYVGAGISGGELGARYGGSIMVGCNEKTWSIVRQIFYDISTDSKTSSGKCCERFGNDGSGHFVKMVHNGIEYCDMDVISESYIILKKMGYTNDKISELFLRWNDDKLKSYLLEIAGKILIKKDEGVYVIDKVQDSAQQKGTGKACIMEAVELSVPTITIVEATFSRVISSRKTVRTDLSKKLHFVTIENSKISEDDIFKTIYLCRSISYIQGFNLLNKAFNEYKWIKNFPGVCDVWSNGCILRGCFLETMKKITTEVDQDYELSDTFCNIYNENISSLKSVVINAAEKGIAIPAISSCFNYINGMRTANSGGNMIQSMRDCFGGHTVLFKGEEDPKHVEWLD